MEITLAIIYYVYLVMIAVFIIFSLLIIYHQVRFGFFHLVSYIIVGLYVIVAIMILIISWHYISEINWQLPLEFNFIF